MTRITRRSAIKYLASAATVAHTVWPDRPTHAAMAPPRHWGYIDHSGSYRIPPQFDVAERFSEGLAAVKILAKFKNGYIDHTGRLVIELPERTRAWDPNEFHDGCARLDLEGDKQTFINKSAKFVGPATGFDAARDFSEGLAAVRIGDRWGFVNAAGEFVLPLRYESCFSFGQGLAAFLQGGKYGYVDRRGSVVIPPRFDNAASFSEGLARIEIDHKSGYIDMNGTIVIAPRYALAGDFHDGLAMVRLEWGSGGWGFIDRQNRMIVPAIYSEVEDFSEGMAQVARQDDSDKERWGFVDTSGKLVIAARYAYSGRFSEGLAFVPDGFIDKQGRLAIPATAYADAGEFADGLARAASDEPR